MYSIDDNEVIEIVGKEKLEGELTPQGSKNGALPLIAASIVFDYPVKLYNIPNIEDVNILLGILKYINCKIKFENNELSIDCSNLDKYEIPWELACRMRASFDLLGPIVFKFSKARIPFPGGCLIGNRKVDIHLYAAKQLGFEVEINKGDVFISNFNKSKINKVINFWIPSVGATKNVVFLAAFAANIINDEILVNNIAVEPEVIKLFDFLISNGFNLEYSIDKKYLKIKPFKFKNYNYYEDFNILDRIEAGTYILAALATKGKIFIKENSYFKDYFKLYSTLSSLLNVLKQIGFRVEIYNDGIYCGYEGDNLKLGGDLKSIDIETGYYPEFPTDLQPQIVALALAINGISTIKEKVFDDRFIYVNELRRLGADIDVIDNKIAIVKGGRELSGAKVIATDIRGGAAILIASLIANNTSIISNIYQIKRGYENLINKFSNLKAKIKLRSNKEEEVYEYKY